MILIILILISDHLCINELFFYTFEQDGGTWDFMKKLPTMLPVQCALRDG